MLIIPQLMLLSENLTEPLSHARIGWNSYTLDLLPDDVTVSSETADGPRDAPNNADTYSFWEPASLPATRDVDFGELKDLDFVGLVGNFGSVGAAIEIRISEDVDDFNDYLALAGVDANYASTPDTVANSITGDLHLGLEMSIENADLPLFSLDFLGDFTASVAKITGEGTFTRSANTATRIDSAGTLASVLADTARQDFSALTRAVRGLLIEESRVNSLRNSSVAGSSSGTPGTPPTNWSATNGGSAARTIVGAGTENGYNYVDIRWVASGAVDVFVNFETTTQVAASVGQAWAMAVSARMVGGSLTNVGTCDLTIRENDAGGSSLVGSGATIVFTSAMQRFTHTRTLANASVAYVLPYLHLAFTGAGDITLRIAMPQLELGIAPSSFISTAGAAVTRNADVAVITDLASTAFNATEGSFSLEIEKNHTGNANTVGVAYSDNTSNERIIGFVTTAPDLSFIVTDGGVTQANVAATFTNSRPMRLAAAYKANDFAASFNAATAATDVSGTLPAVDRLYIGAGGAGAQQLNGWVRSFAYYDSRRVDARLQDFSRQTYRCLASKWVESGNQRSWALCLKENLALVLFISTDGTVAGIREYHSAPLTFSEGVRFRIRVKLDLVSGSDSVCTFQTSDDDAATWDTLSTVTQSTVSGIFDSTAAVEVGAFNGGTSEFQGKVFQFWLHATLADGPVLNFDAAEGETGDTSITSEDTGEVWTIHSTGPATALKIKRFSAPVAPADDAPLMFLDEGKSARRVRVRITGTTPPRMAVCFAGPVLAMQRMIYGGHAPINLSRETELKQALSRGGQFLGQTYRRLGVRTSASFQHLSASWYRSEFDPFVRHVRKGFPYFFAWRPDDYPLEVGYVWTDQDIVPTNMGKRDYLQVSWPIKGIGWE